MSDLYGRDRPWKVGTIDYQGNAAITTEDGLYVCVVPHEVANQIVADHTAARELAEARARVQDLEAALAWYTDDEHYGGPGYDGTQYLMILEDGGGRARAALNARPEPAEPVAREAGHAFMACQSGSCALPHPLPAPDEPGCHWPYGNVFFGGTEPYHQGDPICMLTEAEHPRGQGSDD